MLKRFVVHIAMLTLLLLLTIHEPGHVGAHPLLLSKSSWTLGEDHIEAELVIDKYLGMRLAEISDLDQKKADGKKLSEYVPSIQKNIEKEVSVWVNGIRYPLSLKKTEDAVTGGEPSLIMTYSTDDYSDVKGDKHVKVEFRLFFQLTDNSHMDIAYFTIPSNNTAKEARLNFTADRTVWEGTIADYSGAASDGNRNDQTVTLSIGSPFLFVNGQIGLLDPGNDTAPVILGGSTLLPIRTLIETLGGTVEWEENQSKATIRYNDKTIVLWIDKNRVLINGIEGTCEVMPQMINETTFLPLRFIAENLGLHVEWVDGTQEIIMTEGR